MCSARISSTAGPLPRGVPRGACAWPTSMTAIAATRATGITNRARIGTSTEPSPTPTSNCKIQTCTANCTDPVPGRQCGACWSLEFGICRSMRSAPSDVQQYSSVLMLGLRLAVAVCLVAILLVISGCGSGGSETSRSTRRLSIATGGTGGVFYPYGGGIAKIISENIPNVEATAEVTAASVDNLKFLKLGTSDLAFTMADTAQDAALGADAFADFGTVPARTLAVLYSSYVHLVTHTGSGIQRVADLRGRTVSIGSPGSGTAILAGRLLAGAGLNPQRDLRTQSLGVA